MAAHVPDSRKVSRNLHDAGPGAGVLDRFDASQDIHETYIRHHVRNDDRAHQAQIVLDDRGERQAGQVARERDGGVFVEAAQLFVPQHQPERAYIEGLLHQGQESLSKNTVRTPAAHAKAAQEDHRESDNVRFSRDGEYSVQK